MFAFWKKTVPYQIVKSRSADVQILASLVFAHPVVGYLREHINEFLPFFLRDIAIASVYITEYLLQ